ncbi:serine hydrolase [Candidatus Tisiphia endosymbiont of Beris chalybata]|uniref:serine hydrolase domain-containing protein n=1 Tax=Candidatus Tisiphia endosymbiont of Beris chalybata TaxID=3066262 RepID=UPI00312C7A43
MKYYFTLLMILLLNSAISLAGVQATIAQTTQEYLSSRFLNAAFLFADSNTNLIVGAKGLFSIYGEQLKANQEMAIGASTKPIIAAAILRLQDQGLLNVADKIANYVENEYWPSEKLPKFIKEITIHNLLTHTSGLPEYTNKVSNDLKLSQKENIKNIIKFVFSNLPSTNTQLNKYNYSNSNFILLGMIIEKVSKKDLRKFLHDEFFKPLKMSATKLATFYEAQEMQKNSAVSNYPLRYLVQPNNNSKPKFVLIGSQLSSAANSFLVPYADGGIVSNTFDLIKWHRALHQGKILSENSYRLMTTKHYLVHLKGKSATGTDVLDDVSSGKKNLIINLNQKLHTTYTGYGIFIAELNDKDILIHHPGGSTGFGVRSEVGYIPSKDFYFAILSNVVVQIPKDGELKVDMNNIANQLDISYFREAIINAIIYNDAKI